MQGRLLPQAKSDPRIDAQNSQSTKTEATVAIVGSGRLGTALGIALTCRAIASRRMARRVAHARNAAALISRDAAALGANQLRLLPLCRISLSARPTTD